MHSSYCPPIVAVLRATVNKECGTTLDLIKLIEELHGNGDLGNTAVIPRISPTSCGNSAGMEHPVEGLPRLWSRLSAILLR